MSRKKNILPLPDGVDLAALDAYARKRENERRRAAYRENPEHAMQNRLVSAANLLHRHGLIDEQMRADIVAHVAGGVSA